MFRHIRTPIIISQRTMKNFGHKREPVPLFTTLWHGALTFGFIGSVLEWRRIKNFFFGKNEIVTPDSTDILAEN